mgnify:CR=1 FL=1
MKYLLLFIIMASIAYSIKTENYTPFCTLDNYDHKKLFSPIEMIVNQVTPFIVQKKQKYVNIELPITALELDKILSSIKIESVTNKFKELPGYRYNLVDHPKYSIIKDDIISKISNNVYSVVSKKIQSYLSTKPKYCSSKTSCILNLKDNRILKVGKDNNNNKAIEGQILININNYNIDILVRYVASTLNKFTLHYIMLDGFDFKRFFDSYDTSKFVNIYSNPLVNNYRADKTYLYSSNETPILSNTIKYNKKNLQRYQCYGKIENTKTACEAKYDSNGKPYSLVGVWDKPCEKNSDCPFYKQNKNYPNSFGGCVEQKCEMPIGAESASPTRFVSYDTIICSQCKKGVNCCEKQTDRTLYPKLLSPDYRFKNDSNIRSKYNL